MAKIFKNIWFRCITTLLVIAAISGGLLAILSDVLYVSAEERTGRAIKKIYGEEKAYSVVIDKDKDESSAIVYEEFGEIGKLFVVGDKSSGSFDYLFQTTGKGGFHGGTITLWTQVAMTGENFEIKKVLLESFEKQTLMSKLGGEYYSEFTEVSHLEDLIDGKNFTADKSDADNVQNIVSGATYSASAGNNAVNCVVKYLREVNA